MKINDLAREELFNEVNMLSDAQANQKPSEKEWSIIQVLEHLYLMESTISQAIAHELKNGEVVYAEARPIEATVNRDVKIPAPDFVTPSEQFFTLDELKKKLADSHERLGQVSENASPVDMERKAYPHPVFGSMSLKQWVPFVGYHEIRHTEQIREIKTALGLAQGVSGNQN